MRVFIAALFLCLAVPAAVEAKPSRHVGEYTFAGDRYVRVGQLGPDVINAIRCPPPACTRGRADKAKHLYRVKPRQKGAPVPRPRPGIVAPLTLAEGVTREVGTAVVTVIGGRPSGCPARFCGCGASLHVFGKIIPALNLAANWLRFPRTMPATNMVAARRGHVFVLKQHIAGNTWLVHDSNSGGSRTRLHPRSIAGYVIVNPHGGRA